MPLATAASRLAVGRFPAFRRLAIGRTVVTFGNAMAPIALAFAVLDLTHSPTSLGLVVAGRSAANVVVLLLGGALADRLPRQWLMAWSCLGAALTQAAVATLVITGTATVPRLLLLSIINGSTAAVTLPAAVSVLAQTVPAERLQRANALLRLGVNGALVLGTTGSGILVSRFGPGVALACDAGSFLIGAVLFARLRVPPPARGGSAILADLRLGWTEFVARRWVWSVVLGFTFVNAVSLGGFAVLGVTLADSTIGRARWGLVLAAQMIGMVAGSLVALRVKVRHLLRYGVGSMLLTVVPLPMLALHPTFWMLIVAFFLAGFGLEQFQVAWDTSLQRHVPISRLARVTSYDALGSYVAIPLGELAVGPVVGAIGSTATLLIGATGVLAVIAALLGNRGIRDLAATGNCYDQYSSDGSACVH